MLKRIPYCRESKKSHVLLLVCDLTLQQKSVKKLWGTHTHTDSSKNKNQCLCGFGPFFWTSELISVPFLWSPLQISDWWVQRAYLESRQPLPVHSNAAISLPRRDFNDWRSQLVWVYINWCRETAENSYVEVMVQKPVKLNIKGWDADVNSQS